VVTIERWVIFGLVAALFAITALAWRTESRDAAKVKELFAALSAEKSARSTDIATWGAALQRSAAARAADHALLVGVAETWVENADAVGALLDAPRSLEAQRRRRAAQEAHKRAAEAVVIALYGAAPSSSGVRVVGGGVVKEVANG
jgi:hypothetical protein